MPLTRTGNKLYVHFLKEPAGDAVKVKHFDLKPRRASFLNTGRPVAFALDLVLGDHVEQRGYLRLRGLPVQEMANTVWVLKLEFDK